MCRILALTKHLSPLSVETTLTQFGLLAESGRVMQGIESGHRDGWGAVCYTDGKIIHCSRRPTDASKDRAYGRMVKHISIQTPELSIAHLRKGSVGSVLPENTHPFVFDNWSLCHNGMLFGSENIPLSDDIQSRIQGTSDTERIFLSIMDNLQKKSQAPKDIRASILQVITYIRKHHDYMALNILLSNGRKLWAVREVNEKNAMVKRLRLRTYFSLYVARNRQKQITALCSEKLRVPTSVWKPLPNHCLLEIDIRTHRERQYPIG